MVRTYHSHEGGDAGALNLEDVVIWGDAEVVASQVEGHVREAVASAAVDAVLPVVTLLGAHLLVEEVGEGGWEGNERGSSVKDDTGLGQLSSLVAEADGVEVNLPVCLASQRNLGQLASIVALINTTKDGFRSSLILACGVAQVESEDGFINKTLIDKAVERGNDLVDRDSVVPETQDAVEPAESEGKTWFLGGLSKQLVLDLEVANGHGILGNEASQAARAVLDRERGAILREGRRGRGVVFCVEEAGDGVALRGRNPQVGAAGIENDLEGLRGGADGDLGEICRCALEDAMDGSRRVTLTLSVEEVAHGDDVTALGMDGGLAEHLLHLILGSDAHILLAEVLDMVVDAGASELLREGDLLQGQLVDGSAHRAKQCRSCEDCRLHDCDGCGRLSLSQKWRDSRSRLKERKKEQEAVVVVVVGKRKTMRRDRRGGG